MGAARRAVGWALVGLAAATVVLIHRRFTWIPVTYLSVIVVVPTVGWRTAVWRAAPRIVRWAVPAVAALSFVALLPVPWMTADIDDPPGNAWRLDGRMSINGDMLDPSGNWYWLTVGRPPIIAELLRSWVAGDPGERPVSMLAGRRASRPAFSEPAAAAVGLRRGGWMVRTRIIVEVSEPLDEGLPARAVLARVNGVDLATRDEWQGVLEGLRDVNTVVTEGGGTFRFRGAVMPFGRVDVIEMPHDDLEVLVGGALASTLPGSWYRNLSLGSSHGLMVALVAYVHASHHELARGRNIAGTGKMLADGTVGAIGGLVAKATAARDMGADVLLFPAQQAGQLEGFDAGSMRLVPVGSLDDAIVALTG